MTEKLPQKRSKLAKGIACAILGASLWGFSGACAQLLYRDPAITPGFVTAARTFVAAVALGSLGTVAYRRPLLGVLTTRKTWPLLFVYSFGLFMSQIAFACCIQATNAGTAAVLQSLFMVMVLLVSCVKLRRLPRTKDVCGLACALAGTWLIATGGCISTLSLPLGGLIWGIISAVAVTAYVIAPKALNEQWDPLPVITAGMMIDAVMAVLFWIGAATSKGLGMPSLDLSQGALLICGVGLLGTAIAYVLYLYGVSVVGSVQGSLLGAVEPLSGMLLAFFWLSTPLSGADWLGAAFMITMIVLVSLPSRNNMQGA